MTLCLIILLAALFLAHLEVKCREQERENEAQTRKGSDDDAS